MTLLPLFSMEGSCVFNKRNRYFPFQKTPFSALENNDFCNGKQISVVNFRPVKLGDDRHNLRSNCRRERPIHSHSS